MWMDKSHIVLHTFSVANGVGLDKITDRILLEILNKYYRVYYLFAHLIGHFTTTF